MSKTKGQLARGLQVGGVLTIYSGAFYYFSDYWYVVYVLGAIALYVWAIVTAEKDPNDACDCCQCQRMYQDSELSILMNEGISEDGE